MDTDDYSGTITSKLKPIVTMLTEAMFKDFEPAYRKFQGGWIRKSEDGTTETIVDDTVLWHDVENWLLGLEAEMTNDSDRVFANMTTHMIRKNKGWVTVLTNRLKKHLAEK